MIISQSKLNLLSAVQTLHPTCLKSRVTKMPGQVATVLGVWLQKCQTLTLVKGGEKANGHLAPRWH